MKALSTLKYGFEFRLEGENSSFWFSNWSGVGKLLEQVIYVDIHDHKMRVNDVYLDESWNFNSLYTNIPPIVCDLLKALPICLISLVADRLTWKGNLDNICTARDGYNQLNILEFFHNTTYNNSWKWAIHIPALQKVEFLFWMNLHKSLLTRLMLCHRCMFQTNLCRRQLYTA